MKNAKKLTLLMTILMSFMFSISCSSRASDVNGKMSLQEVERLPEDQRESELDKEIARMRKFRKDSYKIENGSMIGVSERDVNLPGQTKNRPDFTKDRESHKKIFEVSGKYIREKFNVSEEDMDSGKVRIDTGQCIDPRINAIYDDEDKGVAKGYDNENIYIIEYEEKDGEYKYLFLVRESKKSQWKVIHDGAGYKKE